MEKCPQLLDLIPQDREWVLKNRTGVKGERGPESSEEKKLELRLGLGPPGEGNAWINKSNIREDHPLFDFGYFPNTASANRGFSDTASEQQQNLSQTHKFSSTKPPFLHPQRLPVMAKEPSRPCHPSLGELQVAQKNKGFPPSAANPAGNNNNSQKRRAAPPPVVGWPPIRSFRKNLASSSSSKPISESDHQNVPPNKMVFSDKPEETSRKGMFVKINMEGVPIGRKVDLKAYGSYEHLSSAVDELFRGLLAAQRDSSPGVGNQNKQEGENAIITGLLDGSGEYTLVYEDNEGDRMLVGDVPWHMFVSTAKRLRVLKSSEASGLSVGSSSKQERMRLLSRMK